MRVSSKGPIANLLFSFGFIQYIKCVSDIKFILIRYRIPAFIYVKANKVQTSENENEPVPGNLMENVCIGAKVQIIILIDERYNLAGQLKTEAKNLRFRYPAERGNVIKILPYGKTLNLREIYEFRVLRFGFSKPD